MVELIANPEDYEGERVRVEGFGSIEFEYIGLTLSREDGEYLITKNGVGLDLSSEQFREHQHLNERFLRVEGRFTITPSRSYDLWSARLEDVSRIEPISTKGELTDLSKDHQ